MKLSELKFDDKNANRGTKRGRAAVKASLEQFGVGRSVLLDRDGRVIAGNKTVAAAMDAGVEDVEVIRVDGTKLVAVMREDLSLDDPKARGLAVADNRSAQLGLDWDPEVLKELTADVDLTSFFTAAELQGILPTLTESLDGTEDDAPEPPVDPVTKFGDLYIMGNNHRLLCGDATNPEHVARLLNGVKPDLVFTDPPYGIAVQMNNPGTVCKNTILGDKTTEAACAAFNLCTAMDVPMMFWGANHYAADAKLPNSSCWITWDKQEANNHIDQADCELAWTNLKGPARIFHHLWSGFRRDSEKGERRLHPTQKPVSLLVEILDFFKAGKKILDLFGGSGSTLIACERSSRTAYLMELDPVYCDTIVTRWEKLTGKKAEKIDAGSAA